MSSRTVDTLKSADGSVLITPQSGVGDVDLSVTVAADLVKPPNEYWVTKSANASDANPGDRYRAFATLAHAVAVGEAAALPYAIHVGYGDFPLAVADGSGNGLTVTQAGSTMDGVGQYFSTVDIGANVTFGICAAAASVTVKDLHVIVAAGKTATYGVGVSAAVSAEGCHFTDIICEKGAGTLTNAFAVSPDHHADVSETVLTRCRAANAATAGFLIGDGTSGNVLNTFLTNCGASGQTYGIQLAGAGCRWVNGTFEDSTGADIYISQPNTSEPAVFDGIRSEGSNRLMTTAGPSSTTVVIELANCVYSGDALNADGEWIHNFLGGMFVLRNMRAWNCANTPLINFGSSSGAPSHGIVCHFSNITQPNDVTDGINQAGTGNVGVLFNYVQTDGTDAVVAVTAQETWGGDVAQTAAATLVNIGRTSARGGTYYPQGLAVGEHANGKQGVVNLVNGAAVVNNSNITANSRIFLTVQVLGTVAAPKALAVTARTPTTSFTIMSADATDTSTVAYEIFEPAVP
jgi:hypothetical protein